MADQIVEEWREVVGWEGRYSVSSLGRIRSHITGKGSRTGQILAHGKLAAGYHKVTLCKPRKQELVHRIVAAAFIGPCPVGHNINHHDGDKDNNAAINLEYTTPSENQIHATHVLCVIRPSPAPKWGEDHHHAKFTEDDIREMRRLYATGEYFQREIAAIFNTKQTVVGGIVRRERWPHVA